MVLRQHSTTQKSQIFVNDLYITANIGKNYWNELNEAPLNYKLSIIMDLQQSILANSGSTDDLSYSISYAEVSNYILKYLSKDDINFQDSNDFLKNINHQLLNHNGKIPNYGKESIKSVRFLLNNEKCHLKLKNLQIDKTFPIIEQQEETINYLTLEDLKVLTKIGIFDFERQKKQYVTIDLKLDYDEILIKSQNLKVNFNEYLTNDLIENLANYVENTEFLTIEALITSVQVFLQNKFGIINIFDLKISKLNAVLNANSVGLQIINTPMKISNLLSSKDGVIATDDEEFLKINNGNKSHIVYLGFGSNEGDTIDNVYEMLKSLSSSPNIEIINTSSLYETSPMYHLDQQNFLNGALKIKTTLPPQELLKFIKATEYQTLKRVKEFDNGPRTIDIDILMYDNNTIYKSSDLIIPHPRMLERLFVLDPLSELIPKTLNHPITHKSIVNYHHKQLKENSKVQDFIINTIVPIRKGLNWKFNNINDKTMIMGIINMTPDSFSDGGKNYNISNAMESIIKLVSDGANIIDIGATSTRPGVNIEELDPVVAANEEVKLLVPIIEKIRSFDDSKIKNIIISIDTFYSQTARAVLEAGADIINDVSMGMYDLNIYNVVREFKCPYIINHTRGTPLNMTKLTEYSIDNDEFLNIVNEELSICMAQAYLKGIPKWQMILDPGVGFAKTLKQNLLVVKNSNKMRNYTKEFKTLPRNYNVLNNLNPPWTQNETVDKDKEINSFISFNKLPILIGASRKKFIQKITNEKLNLRDNEKLVIGTSGIIMACIANHVNIVRVHDVEEIKKICLLGDAIYNDDI